MELTYDDLVGKTILTGITYLDNEENLIERKQFFGTVTQADNKRGIVIKKDGTGEEFALPPDINSINHANPGEYRLHSTGEVIVNPDFITVWTIRKP